MSSLSNLAQANAEKVSSFYADEPALADFVDECLTVTWHPIVAFAQLVNDNHTSVWLGQMLQTLHSYFRNSALLLITHNFDEGFSLLRMAAELSRDISCIATNPSLIAIWVGRRGSRDARKAYQKSFLFDTESSEGRGAFEAYQFACSYGTHGHLTTLFSGRPANTRESGMILLLPATKAVVQVLRVWLSTLFSLYQVSLRWDLLPCDPAIEAIHQAYLRQLINAGPFMSKQPRSA